MKTLSRKIVIAILLVSVVFGQMFLIKPKPAEAFLGIGDFNFNTQIGNIYDIFKDIALAAAQRIAINYANKYLTRFVDKLIDKYRIKDYLAYDKVLSGYYLNKYLYENVSDPDLRAIYGILATDVSSRATVTDASGQKKPVLVALRDKLDKYYYNSGGINPNLIYNPSKDAFANSTDYFAAAQTFWSNPPSFTDDFVYSQFGQINSSANSAAGQEIAGSNGLKNDRSTPDGVLPRICEGGQRYPDTFLETDTDTGAEVESYYPQDPITTQQDCDKAGGQWKVSGSAIAQSVIRNPSAFIHDFATKGIEQIFASNFGLHDNLYTTIGSLLGNFIFTRLSLDKSGGTFNEAGDSYAADTGNVPMVKDIDIDGDNVPDGIDGDGDNLLTTLADTCYHGGTPPNCKKSGEVSTSPYFTPICEAVDRAVTSLTTYANFIDDHADQLENGRSLKGVVIGSILAGGIGFVLSAGLGGGGSVDNFRVKADAEIWGRRSGEAGSAIDGVINSIQSYHSTYFDNMEIVVSRYANYITSIEQSLAKDRDLDLSSGRGSGGGGLENLMKNTAYVLRYLKEIKTQIGKCENPNLKAVAAVPTPNLIGAGDENPAICNIAPNSFGNDSGAPSSPPSISQVVFEQASEVASWAETSRLANVSANSQKIHLEYDKTSSWPGIDIGDGTLAVSNPWIMVWRHGAWHATTFSWMQPGQLDKEVGDVFCGGAGGSQTLGDFIPTAGETYMFMVSTIARDAAFEAQQGVHERTNIFAYTWPTGITPPDDGTGGSGGSDGPTCADLPNSLACKAPNHGDLVGRVKTYVASKNYFGQTGNCAAFEIVKRVAWSLSGEGGGLMATFHSTQCNGFSADVMAYTDNSGADLLGDAGGANNPQWGPMPPTTESGVHYAPATDPGDPTGSY